MKKQKLIKRYLGPPNITDRKKNSLSIHRYTHTIDEDYINSYIRDTHKKDYYILYDYNLCLIEYGDYMTDDSGDYIDTVGVYTFDEVKSIMRNKKIDTILKK